MKTFAIGAVAALAMLTPALAEEQTVALDAFTAINIGSGIKAVVTVGGPQSVVLSAPTKGEIDEIQISVKDGTLEAHIDWSIFDIFFFGDRHTNLTITVPALTGADANSGATVSIDGMTGDAVTLNASSGADLSATHTVATHVKIDASSGADLRADGSCDKLDANASSGADVNAEELLCKDATLESSSGSDLDAYASASVAVNASSGASVVVHGKPAKVDQDASSGADIEVKG